MVRKIKCDRNESAAYSKTTLRWAVLFPPQRAGMTTMRSRLAEVELRRRVRIVKSRRGWTPMNEVAFSARSKVAAILGG